jgi:hypothetical protein
MGKCSSPTSLRAERAPNAHSRTQALSLLTFSAPDQLAHLTTRLTTVADPEILYIFGPQRGSASGETNSSTINPFRDSPIDLSLAPTELMPSRVSKDTKLRLRQLGQRPEHPPKL